MKKHISILSFLLSVFALQAQYQPSDTLPPCGHYLVTNSSSIAESAVQSALLTALRSGTANITSDDDNSGVRPLDADTAIIIEILANETLSQLSQNELNSRIHIPQSVDIAPHLLTILYEGSVVPSYYPLVDIVPDDVDGHSWSLLRADAPAIRLYRSGQNLFALKIPGQATLRLRHE